MTAGRQRDIGKRDRLWQLSVFCHAARLGSLNKSADYLGISLASVSAQIRQLEYELQAFLFDRSSSGSTLTSAGKTLHQFAAPLIQQLDMLFDDIDIVDQLDKEVPERLAVAACTAGASIILPPYIVRFRQQFPQIRLHVRNCLLEDALKLLLENEVELAFGVNDRYPEATLAYLELMRYHIVLITSREHPLAGRKTISPEEISAWPAIVPPKGTYSTRFEDIAARQIGWGANAVIETGGWGVIKRLVEQGLGIAAVPSIAIHESDQLSAIPLDKNFPSDSFGVYVHRRRHLIAPAREFLQFMSSSLIDHPDFSAAPLVPTWPEHVAGPRPQP